MKSYGNELVVYRSETFTYDVNVVSRDGSPYIVSNKLKNPFLVITIVSTLYPQKDAYCEKWWLDLDKGYDKNGDIVKLPRFEKTTVTPIDSIVAGLPQGHSFDTAVYYHKPTDDYYRNVENSQTFVPYEFRITKTFDNNTTAKWIEQEYKYDIKLVSGNLYYPHITQLRELYEQHFGELPTNEYDDIVALYNVLNNELDFDKSLLNDIDIAYTELDVQQVTTIVPPSKLVVLSNNYGGIQ